MFLISENPNNAVNFVLQPQNYTGLYVKLKAILTEEQYTFFARPNQKQDTTTWTSELAITPKKEEIKSFDELSENDKIWVSDYLHNIKEDISEKLKHDKEFGSFYDQLFQIPSTKDIKVVKREFDSKVIITQWGCEITGQTAKVNPIKVVIEMPKPNRQRVILDIKYSDGTIAKNQSFYFEYDGESPKQRYTKENGRYDLNTFLFGSKILVFDLLNNERVGLNYITVIEGTEIYPVEFPKFTKATVKVENKKKQLMPNIPLIIEYNGKSEPSNSGTGFFSLENLEVGKTLTIKETENPKNTQTYTIAKDKNEFIFKIIRPTFININVKVINQKGQLVPNVPLLIQFEDKPDAIPYNSGETGLFVLEKLETEKSIVISEEDNTTNKQVFKITEETTEVVFKITVPIFIDVIVKVVNQKGDLIPNVSLLIKFENVEESVPYSSGETGSFVLEKLETEKSITITEKKVPVNQQFYKITEDKTEITFYIVTPIFAQGTLKVIDEDSNEIQLHYPVTIEYEGTENKISTGETGIINLEKIYEVGKKIKVTDQKNIGNTVVHSVIEGTNDIVLMIKIPKFRVKIIDQFFYFAFLNKRKAVENVLVDFIDKKGRKISRTTDKDGFCNDLPEDDFDDKQKVEAIIHQVKTDKNGNRKEKIIKKNFIFKKQKI